MDRHPVPTPRRRALETLIRYIDMAIYLAVLIGGVCALVVPPAAVQTELVGWEWLIPVWGAILIVGGAGGFAGRLTRFWVIEVPSLPLAGIGIGMFFVILGSATFSSAYMAVSTMIVLAALLNMVRRYVELQLFASEPGDRTLRARIYEVTHRRTADVVRREG